MNSRSQNAILVTGAGSGIGRSSSLALASAGWKVAASDQDPTSAEETAQLIRSEGGEAIAFKMDVTSPDDVAAGIKIVVETYGGLGAAFNNAGITGESREFIDADVDAFDRLASVNLKGTWLCMREQLRQFLAQEGGGAIINNASVAGIKGASLLPIYSATKHAVIGLTRSAATRYAADKIRVNAICPGVIQTPALDSVLKDERMAKQLKASQPMKRIGEPEEIASAVVWLASQSASFVTGAVLPVDGAMSL